MQARRENLVACANARQTDELLDVGSIDERQIDRAGDVRGREDHDVLVVSQLIELCEECIDDLAR